MKLWRNCLRFLDRVRDEVHGGVIPHGRRYYMLTAYAYCYAKLTRDLSELAAKVATIGRQLCEQPAEDPMTDTELRDDGARGGLGAERVQDHESEAPCTRMSGAAVAR